MKTNDLKHAIDYMKKLITQQQKDIQLEAWKLEYGEQFVNKIKAELK